MYEDKIHSIYLRPWDWRVVIPGMGFLFPRRYNVLRQKIGRGSKTRSLGDLNILIETLPKTRKGKERVEKADVCSLHFLYQLRLKRIELADLTSLEIVSLISKELKSSLARSIEEILKSKHQRNKTAFLFLSTIH